MERVRGSITNWSHLRLAHPPGLDPAEFEKKGESASFCGTSARLRPLFPLALKAEVSVISIQIGALPVCKSDQRPPQHSQPQAHEEHCSSSLLRHQRLVFKKPGRRQVIGDGGWESWSG